MSFPGLTHHKNYRFMNGKTYLFLGFAAVLLAVVFWLYQNEPANIPGTAETPTASHPLPQTITIQDRTSFKYPPGDINYRVVRKPVTTRDMQTGWNTYTSPEYGFTFSVPVDTQVTSTENLGFQLPKELAYKGSRDNFEVSMVNTSGAVFYLFMNNTKFRPPNGTLISTSTTVSNGITYDKQIMTAVGGGGMDEIIVYKTERNKNQYIWYAAMGEHDWQSINEFESIVDSFKFQ